MKTNIFEEAVAGKINADIECVAHIEGLDAEELREDVAAGRTVIFRNVLRDIEPVAVGRNCTTKVNANIGSSPDLFSLETELAKLDAAVRAGAHAVMDLSTGGNLAEFRQKILEHSPIPLGTVPLYEVAVDMVKERKSVVDMTFEDFLAVVKRQADEGVDFMTIHSGITQETIRSLKSGDRIIEVTSRGGSILAEWMCQHEAENPLYARYDEILEVLRPYNIVISLGDGLRPGALHDASDRGQVHEMIILGELAKRARDAGVQAIIEGPGHMPLDKIADNMRLEKSICNEAPYYVLGPLVTDVAPGYDHITSAIGGAIAASSGADFLCYVTPAEHLRLPDEIDVYEGVIASRIAAHAADIVKLGERASQWDHEMSKARRERDWDAMYGLALDPGKARAYREDIPSEEDDQCSMCGEFCAIKRKI